MRRQQETAEQAKKRKRQRMEWSLTPSLGVVANAISGKQAVQHIDVLKKYALPPRGLDSILDLVTQATDIIYKEETLRKSKLEQGSLDSWLNM